jgi:hypothetical protein
MDLRDLLQTIRRKLFRKRYALEDELSGLRDTHTHTVTELDAVRSELSQTREQDARQVVDLQQQLVVVKSERKAAQDHVQLLETSLTEAAAREKNAGQQVQSLEAKLDETRSQYEASVGQTQETLGRLQSEQQDLLGLQTDLAKTFHEVGKQMLESAQTRTPQPRLSTLQTAMLGLLLFLSGVLLSVLVMRTAIPAVDLAPLNNSMIDLQQLMRMQVESYDGLLKIFKESLERETVAPGAKPDSPDTAPADSPDVTSDSPDVSSDSPDVTPADSPDANLTPRHLPEHQRADLALLGFEAGSDVEAALAQFRALYLPVANGKPKPSTDQVDAALAYYAGLARKDSKKYRLGSDILAAIRLASKRTGVEFAFLMELAATESSFNPAAMAPTSTAAGLYQFKDDTWLDTIKTYGHRYGLDAIKQRIVYSVDSKGVRQPSISDPDQLAAALDLRMQPRFSALLAAEHVRRNKRHLSSSLDRKLERTDLYLTHFFGASGAISFLKALAEHPHKFASEIFPEPARRNRSIFHNKEKKPRTVAEIYRLFARKFNTDRFRDGESG